ncbi:hypothetical protein [Methylobacterium sp. WL116]|uniref:relaxase/mobilization nuclease domain-containing protein n=1 Tax=Methylobacterium sp. WL116 TaxID=2603889 RepID=UPI0011C79B67|nr:hypothetical protein [Methylobacterium sp. WL116]TXM92628.1 hypothetical protein FV223_11115 [Methylobacterium sp. WL116]
MISGAMRGKGGDALARHLLKDENDSVEVIPARGLGSPDLLHQVRELVAMSLGGRTDAPCYHVHVDPEIEISDNAGARARWWTLFEKEFRLASQPYCGAVHDKHGRRHEHRVYGLVRRDGGVVDLAWDYARREKVSRIVEFEHGLPPVPSKHGRAIAKALREEGRVDVASWLEASGTLDTERPVTALSPTERLVQERTGVPLASVRAAALSAWHASEDGEGLRAALRERGLRLHAGRSGPVVHDANGTAHLLTRLIGAASKATDGARISAAAVRARLEDVTLTQAGDQADGRGVGTALGAGQDAAGDHGGAGAGGGNGGGGAGRPSPGPERPDDGGSRPGRGNPRHALSRLRGLGVVDGRALVRRLRALDARRIVELDMARQRV